MSVVVRVDLSEVSRAVCLVGSRVVCLAVPRVKHLVGLMADQWAGYLVDKSAEMLMWMLLQAR